jgi:PAS domain S-box-containing protein
MSDKHYKSEQKDELILELQSRLDEAEQTLTAIQNGDIDAIVAPNGSDGSKVYTLESADSLYRNLVQEMNEGVATLTYDGIILYSNTKLASMLQIDMNEIIGLSINDFIIPKDLEKYQTIFDQGLETSSSGEISIKSVEGSVIPVYISINNLKRLNVKYVVITDLSDQKHHEELKKAYDEIEKRTLDLERSNEDLKHFAYVASHDLREPLRMIASFLQLLEKRYKDNLDQEANTFIEFAVDGAKRLDNMINDLIEYSKVTNNKMEFSSIKLENVLNEALISLMVPIKENNAIITYDTLPVVNGNKQLLIQLFQNLIGNAIKYRSQDDPQIHISALKEKDQYLFSVNDNGIGMDSEHINRIFTIFQRLHRNDEYEGTGIGLAIAQKIVYQHGGQIWAESELGNGSTFYFTISEG